jgi:hypothetical protein
MSVTEIGATARWAKLASKGEAIAVVTPWWSSSPFDRGGAPIRRQALPEITVRISIEGAPAEEADLRQEVEAHIIDHESWAQVTGKVPVERLWQGIAWE